MLSIHKFMCFLPAILVFVPIISNLLAQEIPNFNWAVNAGGRSYDESNDIATDKSGNIYIVGSFEGATSFGNISFESSGGYDIFLAKFNPTGEIIWAKKAGGEGYDKGISISLDNSGNVVIAGAYSFYAVFDKPFVEGYADDIFIAKYSENGDVIWVKSAGGQSYDYCFDIATDTKDNIIITGNYQGVAYFDQEQLSGNEYSDIFVAKYDAQGNVLWARGAGSNDYDTGLAVTTNSNNDVFAAGSFSESVAFSSRINTIRSLGGTDLFVVKYDANGNFIWVRSAGGTNYDAVYDLAADDKNLFMTGTFSDTVSFGNISLTGIGYSDLFVANYNQESGDAIWVTNEGEPETNFDGIGIASDASGSLSVIGRKAAGENSNTIYTGKFDTEGNNIERVFIEGNYYNNPAGIAPAINGNILITGSFYENITLGTIELKSNGLEDIFIGEMVVANPQLSLSSNSLGFDSTELGASVSNSLTIINTSDVALHIKRMTILGNDVEDFTITSQNIEVIEPAQSAIVQLQFTPTAPGHRNAYFIVESDASTSPDSAALSGFSALKLPSITPASLDFGLTNIGEKSVRQIRITNPNNYELQLNLNISENSDPDFNLPGSNLTIEALQWKDVDIEFEPSNSGSRSGNLIISGEFLLQNVIVELTGNGGVSPLGISAKNINYGKVNANTPTSRVVNVTNTSKIKIEINQVSFSGNNRSEFSLINTVIPDTIEPDSVKALRVRLVPKSAGSKKAFMIISSNTVSSPDTVELSAVVEIPPLTLSVNSLDFGEVNVNSSSELSVNVNNENSISVLVSNIEISGNDREDFQLENTVVPDSINSNSSKIISIRFMPSSAGIKNALLLISNNTIHSPDTVILHGISEIPPLSLSTYDIDFGSLTVNGSNEKIITLTNTSSSEIIIDRIEISGTNKNEFSLVNISLPDTVISEESKNITVKFLPLSSGVKTAYLLIFSNSINSPDSVLLKGNATISPLTLSDDTLDFGSVNVNNFAEEITSINNSGTSTIQITNLTFEGIDLNEFLLVDTAVQDSIVSFGNKNITIRFTPKSSGKKRAYLVITSNSTSSPDSIILTGTAVSLISVRSDSVGLGQSAILNINPPQGFEFTDNHLFYRMTGELTYNTADLNFSGEDYLASIPAEYSTVRGIDYYIVFSDGENTLTFPENDPVNNPASLEVKIGQILYPSTLRESVYKMISVPINISNSAISTVLGDDYGQYDKSVWRMFRWEESNNNYIEYPDLEETLLPGKAFWLINRSGQAFTIQNAVSVPNISYTINLNPGWNQIGNPFAFPVAWTGIQNSNLVDAPQFWNSETEEYEIDHFILQPWNGYWVNNPNENISLIVNPVEASELDKRNVWDNLKSDEFVIQIKASIGSSARDHQNFIGMRFGAETGYDKFDVLKPPAISNKLNLALLNVRKFARNILPVSKDGAFWDLEISSNLADKNILLEFELKSALPDGFSLWLIDKEKMISVPVNENKVKLQLKETGTGLYRIIVGSKEFAVLNSDKIPLIPTEYTVFQNYPNPFNPVTNISYQLPQKSLVTLEIYDILGNLIKKLVDNEFQVPGIHYYKWDGSNSSGSLSASGIYIYRIKADNHTSSKTMILLK